MKVSAPDEMAIEEMVADMNYSFESNFDDCKILDTEIEDVDFNSYTRQ